MILLCILICILKQAEEHPWEIHAIKSEEMKDKLKIIFMIFNLHNIGKGKLKSLVNPILLGTYL
jgi:hypothetical protein